MAEGKFAEFMRCLSLRNNNVIKGLPEELRHSEGNGAIGGGLIGVLAGAAVETSPPAVLAITVLGLLTGSTLGKITYCSEHAQHR